MKIFNKISNILKLQKSKEEPTYKLTISLEKNIPNVFRKEIDQWQHAKMAFLDPVNPRSYHLQEVYMDALLDAHLAANIANRINRVKNKIFVIKDANDNISPKTKFIEKKWFLDVIDFALQSIFFGYSLIYIKDLSYGNIKEVELIDRRYILPEQKIILRSLNDDNGLNFTLFPNLLLFANFGAPLGLLDKVIPLTILKRHSWANWDEFEQLFGIPIRIARTIDNSPNHRLELQRMLDQMGTAASAVLPKGVDIEIIENSKSDAHNVFQQKIKTINDEISKLINGQTMTMDNGSSYAQSQVHQDTENNITKSDITLLELWLNDILLPALRSLGYPFDESDYLDIIENNIIDPTEKIKIDAILLQNGYILDKQYLETTYDTRISKSPDKNNLNLHFFE